MKAGTQLQFAIPIDKSVLEGVTNGVKDLVLYVANDDGKVFSTYEFATINAKVPYDFKVNGSDEDITIKVGESIELTSTYEPSERYKNAKVMYSSNNSEVATILSNKLIGVATGSTVMTLTTKEFGGSKSINVNVLPADPVDPTPSPTPGPGPRGGGGGGGGGGSSLPNANGLNNSPTAMAPNKTEIAMIKNDVPIFNDNEATWIYDPKANKFRLEVSRNGQKVTAINTFVAINKVQEQLINNQKMRLSVTNTYYFDNIGNMVTGWVKTADNKWYFFENAKTNDEGKMVTGWKQVQNDKYYFINDGSMVTGWKQINNDWYYFAPDGVMMYNSITPDGFLVGMDGKWVK